MRSLNCSAVRFGASSVRFVKFALKAEWAVNLRFLPEVVLGFVLDVLVKTLDAGFCRACDLVEVFPSHHPLTLTGLTSAPVVTAFHCGHHLPRLERLMVSRYLTIPPKPFHPRRVVACDRWRGAAATDLLRRCNRLRLVKRCRPACSG